MKSVFESIINKSVNYLLEDIDTNINCKKVITESLSSPILTEIANQIKSYAKGSEAGWYAKNQSFKAIFGSRGIDWNKVTDDCFEIVKSDASEKERKAIYKKIRTLFREYTNDFAFVKNPTNNKFTYFINPSGQIYSINGWNEERKSKLSQAAKLSYFDNRDVYFLHIPDMLTTHKLKIERNKRKEGLIKPGDEWDLMQIAKQNVDRYKEIIAKNKATKMAENDNISELVNDIVTKAMELATIINKDVIKYADLINKLTNLMSKIYDKETYTGKTYSHSRYSGENGLLYSFTSYIKYKSYTLNNKDFIDMHKRDMESALKQIKKMINECEDIIEEIENNL